MNLSTKIHDRFYYFAFFLVELFASLEITAMVVATPSIVQNLQLPESYSGWIINSYLLPLLLFVIIFLLINKKIKKNIRSKRFFAEGLLYFILGNIFCFLSLSIPLFIFGRIIQGIGAAMAFVGQLWSVSENYKDKITKPLFWGQVGAAIGIIAGPMLGGIFSDLSPDGWKGIFLLNAIFAFATFLIITLVFRPTKKYTITIPNSSFEFGTDFYLIIAAEITISMLAVGAEYFASEHFQLHLEKNATFVGWLTLVASLGIISGSYFMEKKTSNFANWTRDSILGLIISLLIFGLLIEKSLVMFSLLPIFLIGFFASIGWIGTYAYITKIVDESLLLNSSLLYLIAQQTGNALGIHIEEFGRLLFPENILGIIILMIIPPLLNNICIFS